eukprot:7289474-Prymnesium_polylepis.1
MRRRLRRRAPVALLLEQPLLLDLCTRGGGDRRAHGTRCEGCQRNRTAAYKRGGSPHMRRAPYDCMYSSPSCGYRCHCPHAAAR